MLAVVNIAGKQYKVAEGQEIFVHRLDAEVGDNVTFGDVYATLSDDDISLGNPTLGTSVKATVLEHLKDNKVIVFKKKRRKGYKVKRGHRQALTKISIDSIA